MSDNWVVQNLENALEVWNGKLSEIWQLITQSPQDFKGGAIWSVVVNIHGGLQAIGYALMVLFFLVGVVKTCGSFAEVNFHLRTWLYLYSEINNRISSIVFYIEKMTCIHLSPY